MRLETPLGAVPVRGTTWTGRQPVAQRLRRRLSYSPPRSEALRIEFLFDPTLFLLSPLRQALLRPRLQAGQALEEPNQCRLTRAERPADPAAEPAVGGAGVQLPTAAPPWEPGEVRHLVEGDRRLLPRVDGHGYTP